MPLIPPPAIFTAKSIEDWLNHLPPEILPLMAVQLEYAAEINELHLPEPGEAA